MNYMNMDTNNQLCGFVEICLSFPCSRLFQLTTRIGKGPGLEAWAIWQEVGMAQACPRSVPGSLSMNPGRGYRWPRLWLKVFSQGCIQLYGSLIVLIVVH